MKSIIKKLIDQPLLIFILIAVIIIGGWHAWRHLPVDAIPNVGDNQVIVYADWPGRSPQDVEDQITYPLSAAMLGVPGTKSVRGGSMMGYSFVQVTFKDSVDYYWARSRVAERLSTVSSILPSGVSPQMGPDATALGQIFYYVLVGEEGSQTNLAELRSLQDYAVKYALESVEGVSEVASVGGHVRHYQIEVDPKRLQFQDIPLQQVIAALRESNQELGARTLEQSGMEFIIRGTGYLGRGQGSKAVIKDLEDTIVISRNGVPIRIKDIGFVNEGTGFRRGAIDLNGQEAVGGVVVMRLGENPRQVIDRVKARIQEIEPHLGGVRIKAIYDRTGLIHETIATLTKALREQVMITAVIILIFLLNVRLSLIVASVLPLAVLLAFSSMRFLGLEANIMSLAGIAIAIGNVVDMAIVVSENIFRHLNEKLQKQGFLKPKEKSETIWLATREVLPAVITATATTVISFLPVFFLTGRDARLFEPLAWTKTITLIAALLVATCLIPALCRLLLKPKLTSGEQDNALTLRIKALYAPLLSKALDHPRLIISLPLVLFVLGLFTWQGIRPLSWPLQQTAQLFGQGPLPLLRGLEQRFSGVPTDDWIPLDEGSFFYMPSLYPGASFQEAFRVLQTQGQIIRDIPEVDQVLGKIGRAESALDPAPVAMIETYITLKPPGAWRPGKSRRQIWQEISEAATLPGVTPASMLQPIEGRVVMLQSGIRAPMAIRVYGDSLIELAEAAQMVAELLREVPSIDGRTVNPDIVLGSPYAQFHVDRLESGRYGLSVADVQQSIETAIAGTIVDYTVEGRRRFPIEVRYPLDYRQTLEGLSQIPIITPNGEVVSLSNLTHMESSWGPMMIASENGRLVAHITFSGNGEAGALGTVEAAKHALHSAGAKGRLVLPAGYSWEAVGSFLNQIEANQRLLLLIPLVIIINLLLIYFTFQSFPLSLMVFTGIPIAFGGGMLMVGVSGIELNTAVWVGFIALFGIAVDDGVLQVSYLSRTFKSRQVKSWDDIKGAVHHAAMKRVRPCLMTTITTLIALLPILFATGTGADVAKAMAFPIFGGMLLALLVLLVVPVMYSRYALYQLNLQRGD